MLFLMIISVSSCNLFDLDINKDPNNPQTVTPDLLLPTVIYSASNTFAGGVNDNAAGFVGGMISSADSYNLTQSSYVNTWQNLYRGPLKDLDEMIKFCERVGNQPGYLGIAQVLKAYYFSLMVDLWGDVPNWRARSACRNGDSCHDAAPRGSRTGTQGLKGAKTRSMVPYELSKELLNVLS